MPVSDAIAYGYLRTLKTSFHDAVVNTQEALKREGFGVLFQIDMRAKLEEKLGVDWPGYVILGVCNPQLAHQALQQEINLGLLLPCNAVVYESDGQVHVGVVDAARMLSVVGNSRLEDMARQVNEKLHRAIDSIAG